MNHSEHHSFKTQRTNDIKLCVDVICALCFEGMMFAVIFLYNFSSEEEC